jgi:hypothetical protein
VNSALAETGPRPQGAQPGPAAKSAQRACSATHAERGHRARYVRPATRSPRPRRWLESGFIFTCDTTGTRERCPARLGGVGLTEARCRRRGGGGNGGGGA